MASFTKSSITTKRHEYRMTAPVHITEVSKALSAAQQDVDNYVRGGASKSVPEVWVTRDDDHVVVYWEQDLSQPAMRSLANPERR